MCIRGGLSFFESKNKVICYICCHKDLTGNDVVRKLGEFCYDSFHFAVDFTHKSEPKDFRNLKAVLIKHFGSQYHMKMSKDLSKKHIYYEKNKVNNTKFGMGRVRQFCLNEKNKCSFVKYESDCLVSALNGEDIGNINHSRMFAKEVFKEIAVSNQADLKTHFRTPMACTCQILPVG